jgi:hypothetical protein
MHTIKTVGATCRWRAACVYIYMCFCLFVCSRNHLQKTEDTRRVIFPEKCSVLHEERSSVCIFKRSKFIHARLVFLDEMFHLLT